MREVMMKAQALAEAILESGAFQRMQTLEQQVTKDTDAARAIADYMEKRSDVEKLLHTQDMDPAKLAEAGEALEKAQNAMDENALVKEMREAQQVYTEMMDNVNRILRLVVTGETQEEGGCTGDCASCGSCGSCGGCE